MFILKIPMNVLNMFCLIMIGTELVSSSDLCKSRADPESPEPPPPIQMRKVPRDSLNMNMLS